MARKRELIDTGTDKRYVRRNKLGWRGHFSAFITLESARLSGLAGAALLLNHCCCSAFRRDEIGNCANWGFRLAL